MPLSGKKGAKYGKNGTPDLCVHNVVIKLSTQAMRLR